jgi:outer membrane protein assembly factor BamB
MKTDYKSIITIVSVSLAVMVTILAGAVQTSGSIISGKATTIVSAYTDNAVVKLGSNGNILWATNVGGIVYQAVENPTDKTIYAVGGDIFTKLSSDGTILLQTSIPGNGMNIDVDPSDGSFYVGEWSEPGRAIRKYDASGNFIKSFPWTLGSSPAVYRADGSVYVNTYEAGVYKFDKDGNLLWQREPVEWHNAYPFASIVVDQRDGSVIATTWYTDSIVRLDADGNTIWTKSIPRIRVLSRNSIDPNENAVYVSSIIYGGTGSTAIYKLNLTDGNTIWSKDLGAYGMAAVDPFDGSIYFGKLGAKEMTKVDKNSNIIWGPKDIGYSIGYLETTSDVEATVVTIDIKPGNVPVAILSSAIFDATTVDQNTVEFAVAHPLPIGGIPEDVDGDGLLDIVLYFETADLNLPPDDTEACLTGKTFSGQEFIGCESICRLGPVVGDLDGKGKVDFKDFAIFASHWLECTDPNCD